MCLSPTQRHAYVWLVSMALTLPGFHAGLVSAQAPPRSDAAPDSRKRPGKPRAPSFRHVVAVVKASRASRAGSRP